MKYPLKGYDKQKFLVHLERHQCANFGEPRVRSWGLGTHEGVDFYGTPGQEVHNIRRGTVEYIGEFYRGSWFVDVRVGDSHFYRYGELTELSIKAAVKDGQVVEEGVILGRLANLGLEGYPDMLHFEERIGDKPVNPMPFLLKLEAR